MQGHIERARQESGHPQAFESECMGHALTELIVCKFMPVCVCVCACVRACVCAL